MYNPLCLDKTPPPYLFPVQLPHGHTACDWYVAARLGLPNVDVQWIYVNSRQVDTPSKGDIAVFTHRKTRKEMGVFIPSSFHGVAGIYSPIRAELDVDFHMAVVEGVHDGNVYISDTSFANTPEGVDYMEIVVRSIKDLSLLAQDTVKYYRLFRDDAMLPVSKGTLYHLVVTDDWKRVGNAIDAVGEGMDHTPLRLSIKNMPSRMSSRHYVIQVDGGVIDMDVTHFLNGGRLAHLVDVYVKPDNMEAPALVIPEWLASLIADKVLIPYYGVMRLPYVINRS